MKRVRNTRHCEREYDGLPEVMLVDIWKTGRPQLPPHLQYPSLYDLINQSNRVDMMCLMLLYKDCLLTRYCPQREEKRRKVITNHFPFQGTGVNFVDCNVVPTSRGFQIPATSRVKSKFKRYKKIIRLHNSMFPSPWMDDDIGDLEHHFMIVSASQAVLPACHLKETGHCKFHIDC